MEKSKRVTLRSTVFVARRNKDSTEGRGPMIDISTHRTPQEAYEAARGQGVMGVGDGEVQERNLAVFSDGLWETSERTIYGYRRDPVTGQWGSGWIEEYEEMDPRLQDPDWATYQELKRRFEK